MWSSGLGALIFDFEDMPKGFLSESWMSMSSSISAHQGKPAALYLTANSISNQGKAAAEQPHLRVTHVELQCLIDALERLGPASESLLPELRACLAPLRYVRTTESNHVLMIELHIACEFSELNGQTRCFFGT
jgi:hypothetical protein